MFYCRSFFISIFFYFAKLLRPIALKFCTVVGSVFRCIAQVQNFRGPFSETDLGAKNVQKYVRFRTTLHFDGCVVCCWLERSEWVGSCAGATADWCCGGTLRLPADGH